MRKTALAKRIRRFSRDRSGTVSVEYILWVPIIFLFWFAAIQVSLLFVTQSNYWSVARETARLVARHAMTETVAQEYAAQKAALFGIAPTTSVQVNGNSVQVVLSIPMLRVTALNPLGLQSDFQIVAAINHTMEPR